MQTRDHYEVLGVPPSADVREITRAYRRLASMNHPDRNGSAHARQRFTEVVRAYAVLKDPVKRIMFDALRVTRTVDRQHRTDIRGLARSVALPARTWSPTYVSARVQLDLTLEEAYAGTTRYLHTRGADAADKIFTVTIPAGVCAGDEMQVHAPRRAALVLRISLRAHPKFHAQGVDVYGELDLTPWEAALGATVVAPTLGGDIRVHIPAGSQSGRKLRIRGRGLRRGGAHYVVVRIVTPPADTDRARAIYRAMARALPFRPRERDV